MQKARQNLILQGFALMIVAVLTGSAAVRAAEGTPDVLPQGISRLRLILGAAVDMNEGFNGNGLIAPLGNALDRSVTIQDFIAREPRLGRLVNALNGLDPGLGNQLINSNLYADFSTTLRTSLFAYYYGVSPRVSIGGGIPIVNRDIHAGFSAQTVNNSASMQSRVGSLSPDLTAGIYDVSTRQFNTAFFQNAVFSSKGYDAPHDFSKTELGDGQLGAKIALLNAQRFAVATQITERIPTGSSPSLSNVFDSGTGAGSWGTTLQLFQQYDLFDFLHLSAMQAGTASLPDTRQRAVPKDENDSLPSLLAADGQVQDVRRTTGFEFDSELASTITLLKSSLSFWSAYQFSAKGADGFSGPGELYYQGLSTGTDLMKTALEFGVGYSTVPAFLNKKFAVPLKIEIAYNTLLTGRNVPFLNYGRLNLEMYF